MGKRLVVGASLACTVKSYDLGAPYFDSIDVYGLIVHLVNVICSYNSLIAVRSRCGLPSQWMLHIFNTLLQDPKF